jgi:protein subunit release factor A
VNNELERTWKEIAIDYFQSSWGGGAEENRERISIRIASVSDEIRTGTLSNTSQMRFRSSQLARSVVW